MIRTATLLATLLRSVLPGVCLLCDTALPASRVPDLCVHCEPTLPRNRSPCPVCALPLAAGASVPCPDCRASPPPWTSALAPFLFTGDVARWIRCLKDHLGLVEGRTLGVLLAEAAASDFAGRPLDVLVPVPLSLRRLAARGHNQAVTIAGPVARRLGVKLLRADVRRVRSTTPQRALGHDARLRNLAGAFYTARNWTGVRVGIVDDVMTTGATVAELCRTLLNAGAAEVHVLCAARTPRTAAGPGAPTSSGPPPREAAQRDTTPGRAPDGRSGTQR
jgi:ComF family protein